MRFLLLLLGLFTGALSAQPKHCDRTKEQGDTLVCQFLNPDGRLGQEDFYVQDKRIFSRFWYYWHGGYGWVQQRKKVRFSELEGPARTYYPNGKIQSLQTYQDGQLNGDCLNYYPSGMLQLRCRHGQDGEIDGIRLSFYPSGKVQTKTRWIGGRLHDILRYKDSRGNDLVVGSFKWGNGDWIWYENGRPAYRYTYKDGQLKKTVRLASKNKEEEELVHGSPGMDWMHGDNTHMLSKGDTILLVNPSFEEDEPLPAQIPYGWIDLGLKTESPPDLQPGNFEVNLPAQDGKQYVGLVVRENNTWEGIGQRLGSYLKKDSAYSFSVYLTRSQKYMSSTRMSKEVINLNAPTILKIWGYNTTTQKEELLGETTAISHSEWVKYSFTLQPKAGDYDELDLLAYYAPGFENKNGNLLIDNCSPIIKVPK